MDRRNCRIVKVLRAVRFASRYNFALHPDLVSAATHPEIRQALRDKVLELI